jgi:hypothetical protein
MQIYGYQKHDNYMNINWNTIREIRDHLLKSCDWTQLPDAGLNEDQKELWREYRKNLRNIPSSFRSSTDVEWPTIPK